MTWRALFLAIALLLATAAAAQSVLEKLVSPGRLSQPHSRLERRCTACHLPFSPRAEQDRCLACHKPVAADLTAGRGFHGRFRAVREKACRDCHSEHHGRDRAIAAFNPKSFDHRHTDFTLRGAHVRLTCRSCHRAGAKFRAAPAACRDCHVKDDVHRGSLGSNCVGCHTETAWRPARTFDHGRTGFALRGAHRTAACASCHVGQRWKGTPRNCVACHRTDDVHGGSLGPDCQSCHTPLGWKQILFDHDRDTGFALIGDHRTADCASCHVGQRWKGTPRTCVACHQADDTHAGSLGPDCQSCHTPLGWKQILFNHDRDTRFPLQGRHEAAACASCHGATGKLVRPPQTCVACHGKDDVHQGVLGTDCVACHSPAAWKATSFDHGRQTRFPLEGAHIRATCQSCHMAPVQTAKPPMDCAGCHAKDEPHEGRLGASCVACHGTSSWLRELRFDHSLTRFPRFGRHNQVACRECHVDKRFMAAGVACADCHMDSRHGGRFGATPPCAACHDAFGWTDWRFDHQRQTRFPLEGRHSTLTCHSCHARPASTARLPMDCSVCHLAQDVHDNRFGRNCGSCHDGGSFAPARIPLRLPQSAGALHLSTWRHIGWPQDRATNAGPARRWSRVLPHAGAGR